MVTILIFTTFFLSLQLAQNRLSLPLNVNQSSTETFPSLPDKPSMYDITDVLLPPGFVPRSKLSPTIPVAPLPAGLEELVDADAEGINKRWISDFQNLLSYEHLGFLYSRFFSPKGGHKNSEEKHPLWAQLADEIGGPSLEALKTGGVAGQSHPMNGMSSVFSDYRTELATNYATMWEGSLYTKCLDFLLRFSLRFHLAPHREQRFFNRVHELAMKKLDQKMQSVGHTISHKAWRDRVEGLQDELGLLVVKGESRMQRIDSLKESLLGCAVNEPMIRQESGVGEGAKSSLRGQFEEARLMMEVMDQAMDEVDQDTAEEEERERAKIDAKGKEFSYSLYNFVWQIFQ
jgi:hypothetical protein